VIKRKQRKRSEVKRQRKRSQVKKDEKIQNKNQKEIDPGEARNI